MLSNPGKPVTMYSVAGIIGKSFSKAFTKHNIQKGFHVAVIYPLNENIFGEDEFLILLCQWQTLQSGNRTSQCTFKLQGQQ